MNVFDKKTIAIVGAYAVKDIRVASEPLDRENYAHVEDNTTKRVLEHPLSTFDGQR